MGRRTGTPLPKSWRVDQVGCLVGFFDPLCFLCLFSYLAFFLKEIKEVAPIHHMHVVLLRACVDFVSDRDHACASLDFIQVFLFFSCILFRGDEV